jgi:hypothetical protein
VGQAETLGLTLSHKLKQTCLHVAGALQVPCVLCQWAGPDTCPPAAPVPHGRGLPVNLTDGVHDSRDGGGWKRPISKKQAALLQGHILQHR